MGFKRTLSLPGLDSSWDGPIWYLASPSSFPVLLLALLSLYVSDTFYESCTHIFNPDNGRGAKGVRFIGYIDGVWLLTCTVPYLVLLI